MFGVFGAALNNRSAHEANRRIMSIRDDRIQKMQERPELLHFYAQMELANTVNIKKRHCCIVRVQRKKYQVDVVEGRPVIRHKHRNISGA